MLLVAADTFRAAAIEQLAVWAERAGVDLVRHAAGRRSVGGGVRRHESGRGARASTSCSSTRRAACTRGHNLMEELRKIRAHHRAARCPRRRTRRCSSSTPRPGRTPSTQARVFTEALGVTGVVLTKLDGTARGGVALAIRRELGCRSDTIGVGEGVETCGPSTRRTFAAALFAFESTSAAGCASSLTRDAKGN